MKRISGEFGEEIGLGDLPEDISRERMNVNYSAPMVSKSSTRNDALGDIRYQDIEKTGRQESGTVPYSGEVISTYASRPINSIDFSSSSVETWPLTAVATDSTFITASYTPVGGYIGVLRGYRFKMLPMVPIDDEDFFMDIQVNGVSQLGYQSVRHGQLLNDFVPCFILADAGQTIDIILRATNGINSVIPDIRKALIEIHGNLLQVTGAPLQLEIANKEIGLPVKTAQSVAQNRPGFSRGGAIMRSFMRSRNRGRFRFF